MARKGTAEAAGSDFTPAEQAYIESGGETALEGAGQQDQGQSSQDGTQQEDVGQQQQEPAAQTAGDQQQDGQQRQSMVPHQALHEERERRKQAEQRERESAERQRLLEERTNIILQRMGQQQPQDQQAAPVQIPDLDKDPVGHFAARNRVLEQQVQELLTREQQRSQQGQQMSQLQQIQSRAQVVEQEFMQRTPDYSEATNFLATARHKELELMGYADPAVRHSIIQNEARQIAIGAFQNGQNPAEIVYNLAKHRGFTTKAASQSGQQQQTPAQPSQPNLEQGQQRMQQLQQGQAHASTVGAARGGAQSPLTAQRLLEMSPAEFDKALATSAGRALMGN